jgi:hypothetical protein
MDTVPLDTEKLPLWQCHKKVRGAKVVAVTTRGWDTVVWQLETGQEVVVDSDLKFRGGPDPVGGYFVLYLEDGFQSWSPGPVFEKGYTRID